MEMHDGNLFFKHKYPSLSIEYAIDAFNSFEEFEKFYTDDLMGENLLLADYLYRLLDRYDMSANRVALEIGRSHSYVRKIVNGKELNPTRDVLIAICVRIGATVEETQILLKYAGKAPLYARRKRDAIIWFALKKRQSLYDLDRYLDDKGYAPLVRVVIKKEE